MSGRCGRLSKWECMDLSEEHALVQRLVRMDEQAWEAFCRAYSAALLGFVRYRFGADRQQAQDVIQMTFARCVRSIHTFKPSRGRLLGWLRTVAANEARTYLGRRGTKPLNQGIDVLECLRDAIDTTPLPDELLAQEETRAIVQGCLTQINSRYRVALMLRYAEDLSVAAVGDSLGVSAKAAESLLGRARAAFEAALLEAIGSESAERWWRYGW